jgi:hypothetical protein
MFNQICPFATSGVRDTRTRPTTNGEWRMGNGEWRMGNGEWPVNHAPAPPHLAFIPHSPFPI